jgi:hypothetical protein
VDELGRATRKFADREKFVLEKPRDRQLDRPQSRSSPEPTFNHGSGHAQSCSQPNDAPNEAQSSPGVDSRPYPNDAEHDFEVAIWPSDLPQDSPDHAQSSGDVLTLQHRSHFSGDGYETAVHGLLALGTGAITASEVSTAMLDASIPEMGDLSTMGTISEDTPGSGSCNEQSRLVSEERELELMRHYRYEVAPWVRFQVLRKTAF